ncbi:MAG: PilZ domain-containing protein [Desulfuromonadales bacterium]|jgi:hypothetical protein
MDSVHEKRDSERIQVEIPVHIGDETAVTRNISWAGIFLYSTRPFEEGGILNFCLDLDYAFPGKAIRLDCRAVVMRVEDHGERYGVAARINHFEYLH